MSSSQSSIDFTASFVSRIFVSLNITSVSKFSYVYIVFVDYLRRESLVWIGSDLCC